MGLSGGRRRVVTVDLAEGHDGAYCSCGSDIPGGIYTLEVPADYDEAVITAEDVLHDPAISRQRCARGE